MTKMLLEAVQIETRGGYIATITSIEPGNEFCVHGTITKQGRSSAAKWNKFGTYSGPDKLASIASLDQKFASIIKIVENFTGR